MRGVQARSGAGAPPARLARDCAVRASKLLTTFTMDQDFRIGDAALSGVAGAVAVTTVHQVARKLTSIAPRMDQLGVRALTRGAHMADIPVPGPHTMQKAALAGDLVCNSAYYSLATTWKRGIALGLAAGVGALVLPQRMGLGEPPNSDRLSNKVMTVAWYVAGGLAAAATATCLATWRQRNATDADWRSMGELGQLG
jgi:hypothetical protein